MTGFGQLVIKIQLKSGLFTSVDYERDSPLGSEVEPAGKCIIFALSCGLSCDIGIFL